MYYSESLDGSKLQLDLSSVKSGLYSMRQRCRERYLRQGSKWCGQMLLALDEVSAADHQERPDDRTGDDERDRVDLAYDYMQCGEMDRAAELTESCCGAPAVFLHMYSRYLAAERRRVESTPDPLTSSASPAATAAGPKNAALCQLRVELEQRDETLEDGFVGFLHGMVLNRLELRDRAVETLCRALRREPLLWPAWLELSTLVTERDQLSRLQLPEDDASSWMRQLFTAHVYLELQMNAEAMAVYEQFHEAGLHKSGYVCVQRAIAHQNLRQVDEAIELFQQLARSDPCRLENMDAYSNLLFVKGLPVELCALAHKLTNINKYSVETCCVVGNYYSLKNQHEKAILYFQRALKVCPSYLAAWTLMGHEYLELKNTNAAIQCYRQAIDLNQLDYRAWYGLGQTYEILKMPLYCQYYYQRAHQLRPNDSRMLMAMGESYEKLEKLQEAKRCYWKAHSIGDIEGVALLRLARLFERLGEVNRAAAAYSDYIRDAEGQDSWDAEEQAMAYRFMANYQLERGQLDEAHQHACRCAQFPDTREEGRAILREVAQRRCDGEAAQQQLQPPDSVAAQQPSVLSSAGALTLRSGGTVSHHETPRTPSSELRPSLWSWAPRSRQQPGAFTSRLPDNLPPTQLRFVLQEEESPMPESSESRPDESSPSDMTYRF